MAKDKKPKKKFADLPAWYHRIRRQTRMDGPHSSDEVEFEDFDEDISELEEEDEESFVCHCEAADDPEYGCECEPESDEPDDVSERSYDGPDAHFYYEFKDMREERKVTLKELREWEETKKQSTLESHRSRVEEVQAAYEALEKELQKQDAKDHSVNFFEDSEWGPIGEVTGPGKMVTTGYVRSKDYGLYSIDYVENCYQEDIYLYWKYVSFEEDCGIEDDHRGKSRHQKLPPTKTDGDVECRIYADSNAEPYLKPFRAPDRLSLETYRLESSDKSRHGKYEIAIQFVGQDYLKMQVPRVLINAYRYDPVPASAPEVFEFVGVIKDYSKRKAETEDEQQKKKGRHCSLDWKDSP
ncbi:hypothetical protein F4819DRAFT_444217 [Hypoxylon fuscum]|nr:hypothetical protein F4819DRAFT_444217 [Hypoxylon fuscum]